MKKRIFNVIELILQLAAIALLFIDGAYICHNNTHTFSYIQGVASPAMIAKTFLFFAINAILCIVSIFSKSKKRDNLWHVALPFVNIVALFLVGSTIEHECLYNHVLSTMWVTISTTFYIILAILIAIVFVSFIKRSVVPKEEKQSQQIINNIAETTNADELKKYKDLLDSGAITQEEYDTKKKELLGL